jgi:hypothetical protein
MQKSKQLTVREVYRDFHRKAAQELRQPLRSRAYLVVFFLLVQTQQALSQHRVISIMKPWT